MPIADDRAIQRRNIIFWHAAVCQDGAADPGAAWKKNMAEAIGVSPGTLTKWCSEPFQPGSTRTNSEGHKKLAAVDDKTFAKNLGFRAETGIRKLDEQQEAQRIIRELYRSSNHADHADLCFREGLRLNPLEREKAEQRQAEHENAARGKSLARWRIEDEAYWFRPALNRSADASVREVPMFASEEIAIAELSKTLSSARPGSGATIVNAAPNSGLSHALRTLLPMQDEFPSCYGGGVHHVHVDALANPDSVEQFLRSKILHDAEVEATTSRRDAYGAERLANFLQDRRQLLIMHGASPFLLVEGQKFIHTLADALANLKRSAPEKRVSRLLLTCWQAGAFRYLNNGKNQVSEYSPPIATDEIMPYFQSCFDHYLDLRHQLSGPNTSRLARPDSSLFKRVAHHYTGKTYEYTEAPSAVRFRAFCASEVDSPSPFDPTQGILRRIDAAIREKIPEIVSCLADTQADIGVYKNASEAGDLTTLRVVSTGLFFLTENMLDQLKRQELTRTFLTDASIDQPTDVGKYVHQGRLSDDKKFTTMPLLVRSLVQDDWIRDDPSSRCATHEAIASVLSQMASVPNQVKLEFELPYTSPRNHDSIALALEIIRHLMRAADRSNTEEPEERKHVEAERLTRAALKTYDEFLEAGVFQTHQHQQPDSSLHYISRRHGLVGLKYEVLCLLSEDGRGALPPRGADNAVRVAFFRELGVALTRMLRPHEALVSFASALSTPDLPKTVQAHLLAHKITAHLTLGDIAAAEDVLHTARSIEVTQELHPELRDGIRNRNDARKAWIALAKGEADLSAELWNALRSGGLFPYWGDRVIGYLDAHFASTSAWEKETDIIWRIAEQAYNKAHSDGLEDECLRIGIRRAGIVRRLGRPGVAEVILDHVGLNLGRHGGSEVVFREFQLESAETLKDLGRSGYAFAAYAFPAFQALHHTRAVPMLQRARQVCRNLLAHISTHGAGERPKDSLYRKAAEENDRGLAHPFFSINPLPPEEVVEATMGKLTSDVGWVEFSEVVGR